NSKIIFTFNWTLVAFQLVGFRLSIGRSLAFNRPELLLPYFTHVSSPYRATYPGKFVRHSGRASLWAPASREDHLGQENGQGECALSDARRSHDLGSGATRSDWIRPRVGSGSHR